MLEPLRNPANWDNFRKAAVLVLIIWAAASAVLCIIYFFILGGRSPAPANIFRALILLVPFIARADRRTGSSSRTRRHPQSGGRRKRVGAEGGGGDRRNPKTAQMAADLVHEVLGEGQQGQCICFRDRGLGRQTLAADCAVRL